MTLYMVTGVVLFVLLVITAVILAMYGFVQEDEVSSHITMTQEEFEQEWDESEDPMADSSWWT